MSVKPVAIQAENSTFLAWKKYVVLLNRVNTNNIQEMAWPEQPS
ncbi:tail fiber assembly protein [Rahnella sp. BCC 1045]|nr:tail fiber assembly protein [Rahnella sp. BCC 1045]